jgi:hypothetical protein
LGRVSVFRICTVLQINCATAHRVLFVEPAQSDAEKISVKVERQTSRFILHEISRGFDPGDTGKDSFGSGCGPACG